MDQNVNNDMSARAVINSAYDITNVVPIEQERDRILRTAQRCYDILREHYGPHSDYAMLIDNSSIGLEFRPNVFTRDGIGILKATEFASPLERYIKDLITYIGLRVDTAAKDGTTTAMMVAAKLIEKGLSPEHRQEDQHVSLVKRQKKLDATIDKLLAIIDSITHSSDLMDPDKVSELDAMRIAGDIAYMQALSSSGGNRDLAEVMREIFSKSPRPTWEYITYGGSIHENDKPFSVDISEYDFSLKCVPGQYAMLTDTLGSEYIDENVACYIYTDNFVDGDFRVDIFLGELKDAPADQPVMVITQKANARFLRDLNEMNKLRDRKYPITVWEYASPEQVGGQSWAYDLMILAAQAGVSPVDRSIQLGEPVEYFVAPKVHWYAPALHFYNCITTEQDSCLHPYFAHPEQATPYYTEVLNTCKKQLELYQEGHRPDGKMEDFFRNIMNRLITVRRPTLRLGGTTHEQIANRDVAQDVQGAIMASLTGGYVLGLPSVALTLIKELQDDTDPDVQMIVEVLRTLFIELWEKNTDVSANGIFDAIHEDCIVKTLTPDTYYNFDEQVRFNSFKKYLTTLGTADEEEYYPPIQPAVMYKELFKRIKELIFKFMWSNQIIVSGALLVDKDKEKTDADHESK